MQSHEIRKRFLDFFAAREHRVVRSSSLVPAHDPTLLFSNAGMNQFKDVFLGAEKRDYTRACSSQKCVRAGGKHNDLEQVGRTARHHTFFEMLGNFSFGDYFKKDAIALAWELLTSPNWFDIPKGKLYITVFDGTGAGFTPPDEEAQRYWQDQGVPLNRIFQSGAKDNFWSMGNTGPCGPCSEIYYDMGPEASEYKHSNCNFGCECGRYVEIWNLVFMQYNVDAAGVWTQLPKPSIDTGAGLERLAAVLQGKISNFETDLFTPLIQSAALLTIRGETLPISGEEHKASLRIIADHARACTFLIADGVVPSNEGRGYVLRKILRRAIRHGRLLGKETPFMGEMVYAVRDVMKDAYPELIVLSERVSAIVLAEENKFAQTLAIGLGKLEDDLLKVSKEDEEAGGIVLLADQGEAGTYSPEEIAIARDRLSERPKLSGDKAFKLYDTFGLPRDFIEDVCHDRRVRFDASGFDRALTEQRARARASWKGAEKKVAQPVYQQLAEKLKTEFDGYLQTTSPHCKIVAIVQNGRSVSEAKLGDEVEIVLDHTPFYAESGGQVGDRGQLLAEGSTQVVAHVKDTYRPVSGLTSHKAVAREAIHVGDVLTGVVDKDRREATIRNHTGTHLLHAALRHTLGPHVKQAGSLVAPDRLRFDFSHYAALGEQDLLDIEDLVNQHVLANEEMRTEVMDLDTAISTGAMALFGEKYGDKVRVVSVADGSFSKELCGGTHVHRTGDIGLFKVVSEASVAAGTRRIEALTGVGVLEYLRQSSQTIAQLSATLRAKPDELLQAAEKLSESEKKLRKQLEAQQLKSATSEAGDLLVHAKEVKGVRVLVTRVEVAGENARAAMRQMVDNLRPRLNSGVIVLGSAADGKVSLIVGVTKDLTNRLDAGKIVKAAAAIVGGSGGGRKDLAEAGGTQPDKLDASLEAIPSIIEQML